MSTSCVPGSSHFGTPSGTSRPSHPAGRPHAAVPAALPADLLLLPQGVLLGKFWLSPPAGGAVAEPHKSYSGETRFPLIVQNVHRYFFYAAVIVSLINTYDFFQAFRGADGGFGIGLRYAGHRRQRGAALVLHPGLPQPPQHRRRPASTTSRHPVRYRMWGWVLEAQRAAHAVRLDHPGQPRRHRRLHRPGELRCHQRPPDQPAHFARPAAHRTEPHGRHARTPTVLAHQQQGARR